MQAIPDRMQDNIEPMFADTQKQKDNTINIERILSRIGEYWPSIIICVVIALICAFVYLRYTTPVYAVHAKVLIKSDQSDVANGALLSDLGVHSGTSNVESEIEIFKSRILMQHVVEDMDLNILYSVRGKIQTTNLYNDAPFRIVPLYNDSSIRTSYSYTVSVKDANNYQFNAGVNKWDVHAGDTVNLTAGKVYVEHNPLAGHMYDDTKDFIVSIVPTEGVVDNYIGALTAELINRQTSIITLSLKDPIPQRGEDLLERLIIEYQRSNVSDKNQVAEGTIEFIDGRLKGVTTDLTGVEKTIATFKSNNNLTDIDAHSKMLVDNTSTNTRELLAKEVQLKVLESLEKYLESNSNTRRLMPATLIAEDGTLVKIIEDYNNLQTQRQRLMMTYTESSSNIRNIDVQLDDIRSGMKNYISSLKRGYQITVNEMRNNENIMESKVRAVPAKEREYFDYARQQQIKQELYLFLLKKREETAISKSATVSNLKVIDPSKRDSGPISPKRSRILLMALVIGLIVPGIRITAKELFNNRIISKSDIESITSIPVIAEVGRSHSGEIVVVKKDSKTIIAEQFRALRTNLQFMLTGTDEKVILVTSSMSGEGKSFVSINLAATMALSGKKVVLLELDLRKPKIAEHLGIQHKNGFSNYAIGQATVDDIIAPSNVAENFSVITSGPIPPNPSELVMLPKVQQLFDELKTRFDHIIIDTAPVGLVTDAQLLSKYANAVMYILRQGYTYKQQLRSANELYTRGKMPSMGLIVNDVKMAKGSDYGYGYGGHNSGYFEDDARNNSKLNKIFKRK